MTDQFTGSTDTSSELLRRKQEEWLTTSLTALSHPSPSSFASCLLPSPSKENNDGEETRLFESLVVWLEDRVIRQWNISSRRLLRDTATFWTMDGIQKYLSDLECPECYYLTNDGDDPYHGSMHWRLDEDKRIRVLFWLIHCCAISEAYSDKKHNNTTETTTPQSTKTTTIVRPSNDNEIVSPSSVGSGCISNNFLLGCFSSIKDDEKVQRIIALLRMNYLFELRTVQDDINTSIANMQLVTVVSSERSSKQKQQDSFERIQKK